MVCERLTASLFVHRFERCGPVTLGGGGGVPKRLTSIIIRT